MSDTNPSIGMWRLVNKQDMKLKNFTWYFQVQDWEFNLYMLMCIWYSMWRVNNPSWGLFYSSTCSHSLAPLEILYTSLESTFELYTSLRKAPTPLVLSYAHYRTKWRVLHFLDASYAPLGDSHAQGGGPTPMMLLLRPMYASYAPREAPTPRRDFPTSKKK